MVKPLFPGQGDVLGLISYIGRPQAQNDHGTSNKSGGTAGIPLSSVKISITTYTCPKTPPLLPPPTQQLPPPNNPNINSNINIISKGPSPGHEAGNHQANPSSSSHKNAGISRPDHQAGHDHYHHQHARPLHVVQLPPSNLHSANLVLHQQINNWPHHNYNAFVPSAPRPPSRTYYPPPHHHRAASADAFNHFHHHHHRADSADAIYYSTHQVLFPPPAAYQIVPHQQLQLQYYNHASGARNQLQPVLHYNNHFAETGIPIQNIEYVPVVLLTRAGIDGTWKTGFFECMQDPPNALMTLLCPCWVFGQIAKIVDNGRSSCATNTLIYMLVMLCIFVPCLLSCTYRKKLRNKFDLPESPAPDCISHFLCEWCALCQEHRELQLRGLDPSLGWVGNMEQIQRMQQKRQAAMNPPATQRMTGY